MSKVLRRTTKQTIYDTTPLLKELSQIVEDYDQLIPYEILPNESTSLTERGNTYMGIKDGPVEFFDENGNIFSRGNYKDGKLNGLYTIFYNDSGGKNIFTESNYDNGKLNGPYKSYYRNGKIAEEGSYVRGELKGKFKRYDDKGRLTEVGYYRNGEEYGRDPEELGWLYNRRM